MRNIRKKSFLVLVAVASMFGCTKEKVEGPNDKIAGTWKYESIIIKESGSADLDYWALVNAFYPCSKNISINFAKDNVYSVSEPAGCVDPDGASLSLLPKNGKFELSTDNTKLTIFDESNSPIAGAVVINATALVWTVTEVFEGITSTIIITLKKS